MTTRGEAHSCLRQGEVFFEPEHRAKYQEMDTRCAACGEEDEAAEHVILYCKGLYPMPTEYNIDSIKSLGFRDSEGKVDFKGVEITKQRLSEWWHKAREN